jgi:NAD(P)H dehydrogenase (quinone)
MIVITGATGQLGRLVIDNLLKSVPAAQIVAAVRNPDKAADLAASGLQVRKADYDEPSTLDSAFHGATKVLLISSNDLGKRITQHQAVVDAAKRAKVQLIAYTSLLHADSSPLALADEHRQTEVSILASGLPYALLRNGWYTENYALAIPAALAHNALIGSSGEGRISSASRDDYAAAAAAVLTSNLQGNHIYELAGDASYTLAEFAAEISKQSKKLVSYVNMPELDYKAALVAAGMPEHMAGVLADSGIGASAGGLFDDSKQLSKLIGRPTTPMKETVAWALAKQAG